MHSVIVVLGLGNTLLSDDGVGVHAVETLSREAPLSGRTDIAFRDGGTLGLSLLPEIENARGIIVIDAAETGSAAGTVTAFEGAAMDAQLRGRKRTAHEVAIAGLMGAAALSGCLPERRALVAVQPASVDVGLAPSDAVAAALPHACAAVRALIERWSGER